jgi:hypothetical protein
MDLIDYVEFNASRLGAEVAEYRRCLTDLERIRADADAAQRRIALLTQLIEVEELLGGSADI